MLNHFLKIHLCLDSYTNLVVNILKEQLEKEERGTTQQSNNEEMKKNEMDEK